ncbi:hypothetical protein BGZ70_008489 [Mortierella alpina]|uniref:Dienelactone hydrolase domain-containing protein n=1 Tax=Mortierella alpina TaxID=64518 RepID=A0A9P6J411_MORAP|nr:hypothetical protein BGZ70_008489 [Mortierella alpina]
MDIQVTEACCNTPATKTVWSKKGAFRPLSKHIDEIERQTYRVGPSNSKRGVVALIDIHGFHPTTTLAEKGFQVSAIDLYKNGPIPDEYMGDMPKLGAWIRGNADYKSSHIDEMIKVAIHDLQTDGCDSIFASDSVILGVAGPHPTAVTVPLVAGLKCPLAIFPSLEEPDMLPVIKAVNDKGFPVPSLHLRFDNMPHGFCGGRGDWSLPEQHEAAQLVLQRTADFFVALSQKET